jgi:hypothetical protein
VAVDGNNRTEAQQGKKNGREQPEAQFGPAETGQQSKQQ